MQRGRVRNVPELGIRVKGFSLTSTELGSLPAMSQNGNTNKSITNNNTGIRVRD